MWQWHTSWRVKRKAIQWSAAILCTIGEMQGHFSPEKDFLSTAICVKKKEEMTTRLLRVVVVNSSYYESLLQQQQGL